MLIMPFNLKHSVHIVYCDAAVMIDAIVVGNANSWLS